jgi:hypothetical protein
MTLTPRRRIEEGSQAARNPAQGAKVLAAADPGLRSEVASLSARDSSRNGVLDQPALLVRLGSPARILE